MNPASFCSIATESCANELIGLLLSLSVHHPGAPVICLVDAPTQKAIQSLSVPLRVRVEFHPCLNEYTGLNRKQMEAKGVWTTFQMMKSTAIDLALKTYPDTLFLDSDILVLNPITVDKTKRLGVSPHYIRKRDTDKFGYYNGGALWTSDPTVPEAWREFTKTSRFFDQASIEDLAKAYPFFEFGEQCNISWWRLNQSDEDPNKIISHFATTKGQITYKSLPVAFVHTHFSKSPSDAVVGYFNNLIMSLLKNATRPKELTIIGRIMNGSWTIHVPKQPMPRPWDHTNDSFREEIMLIQNKNKQDVSVVFDGTKNLVLEPAVMLYDRDTIQWFQTEPEFPLITGVYLGNCDMANDGKALIGAGFEARPWIYWPRRPIFVEALIMKGEGARGYAERPIESLFIGNYENAIQQQHRTSQDWSKSVSEFHLTSGSTHKFTPKEYLQKLAQARFGLTLRGYGVKCHREVELMAFGTVPIVTPNVNTTDYQEPLVEGVHYVRANHPSEVPDILKAITPEQWQTMSIACKDWYMRNIHSTSMWSTFMSHVLYDN